jgi:hypothetical protein
MSDLTTDTNGFIRHNIDHLSPSSLNMSMGSLSAWCVRYLLRQRFPSGWAAERGKAVEVGVALGLFDMDRTVEECTAFALETFDNVAKIDDVLNLADGKEKARKEVEAMVPLALEELRPLGVPTAPPLGENQRKIGIDCRFRPGDNGTVHILGYLDFYYAEKPLVVDLKTTGRMPSSFSQAHGIQAAIYARAMKCPVRYLYVTPKAAKWLEITEEEIEHYLEVVRDSVKRLERFLNLSNDGEQLAKSAPLDPSSFYWRGASHLLQLIS